MKTIKQVADELNITTQTVYKKINKTMKDELLDHVKRESGQTLIDETGIVLIKNSVEPFQQYLQAVEQTPLPIEVKSEEQTPAQTVEQSPIQQVHMYEQTPLPTISRSTVQPQEQTIMQTPDNTTLQTPAQTVEQPVMQTQAQMAQPNTFANEIISFFREELKNKEKTNEKNDEYKNKIIEEKNNTIADKDRIIIEKEKTITEKDLYLKEKDKRIDELTEKITDLTERLAILFENSQQLQQNQQVLEAKTIKNENNNFIDNSEKKRGFFKKRFGKK